MPDRMNQVISTAMSAKKLDRNTVSGRNPHWICDQST
jgi:hypothetical protein